MSLVFARSVGNLTPALKRNLAKNRGMYDLIDETRLISFFRADIPARENHVERSANSDQSWKSLRSPCTGDQSELNFGKREYCFRVIARNAIRRCKRELERTTQAGAVYR